MHHVCELAMLSRGTAHAKCGMATVVQSSTNNVMLSAVSLLLLPETTGLGSAVTQHTELGSCVDTELSDAALHVACSARGEARQRALSALPLVQPAETNTILRRRAGAAQQITAAPATSWSGTAAAFGLVHVNMLLPPQAVELTAGMSVRCALRDRADHRLFPCRVNNAALIECDRLPQPQVIMRTAAPARHVSANDSQLATLLGGRHGAADKPPAEGAGRAPSQG